MVARKATQTQEADNVTPITRGKRGPKPGSPQAQRGGAACKALYGREHYQRIGKLGGNAVRQEYGANHFRHIGHAGGSSTKALYGREHYERIGKLGGAATRGKPKTKYSEED